MRRSDFTEPFTWIEIEDLDALVLAGPGKRKYKELSEALTYIRRTSLTRKEWVRWVRSFVWILNQLYPTDPEVAARFTSSVKACRSILEAFLQLPHLEITLSSVEGGPMRWWVNSPPDLHGWIKDALMAFGMVTGYLATEVFGGQDPAKLDNKLHQVVRDASITRTPTKPTRRDTFRIYRIRGLSEAQPRMEDPRHGESWLEAAAEQKVSEVFRRIVKFAKLTGGRACSILPLTLADLLLHGGEWGFVAAPSKGSKGKRCLQLTMDDEDFADFEDAIDKQLIQFGFHPLEHYKALAEQNLKGMAYNRLLNTFRKIPLFSEDGHSLVKYDKLACIYRQVAERAKLYFRDIEGDRHTIKFHQLRHEFIFESLLDIDDLPEEQRESARAKLKSYMGWAKNSLMLDWYSKHYELFTAARAARSSARRRARRDQVAAIDVPSASAAVPQAAAVVTTRLGWLR